MNKANTLNNLIEKPHSLYMNPMALGRECLGHDVCCHVVCRYILNGNETVLIGLSNEMILDINVFHSFMKARIFGKLNSSLVIHEEKLRICRLIGFSEFMK